MEWLDAFYHNWVMDSVRHFLLVLFLASAASWLILTISSAVTGVEFQLHRSTANRVAIYGMIILALLVGLSVALLSHAALDGFAIWYVTPLGPPLDYGGM